MQGIRQFRNADGRTAGDRFGRGNIQIGVGLLKDLHPVQEMFEFGSLGQEGGLSAAGKGQEGHDRQEGGQQ